MNRSWFRLALEENPVPFLHRFIIDAVADHLVTVGLALDVAVGDTILTFAASHLAMRQPLFVSSLALDTNPWVV